MRFIDWFAGIGGFRRGLELAGHKCVGFCEWDKFAAASYTSMHLITEEQRERLAKMPLKQRQKEILKDEYRNREWYASDIRYVRADDVPDAECWCFGAPCQDFSVARKRAGLDGDRSSLVREIFRLVREKGEENKPEWLIYENVKGMLSSNRGFDFLAILLEMDELGYDCEWFTFNSKYHGVPQNRERVYTIGHLRAKGERKILPISGTNRKDSVSIDIIGHRDGYRRNTQIFSPSGGVEALSTCQGGGREHHTAIPMFGIDYNKGGQERQIANTVITRNTVNGLTNIKQDGTAVCVPIGCIDRQGRLGKEVNPKEETPTLRAQTHGNEPEVCIPVLTPDRAEKRQNGRRMKDNGDEAFTLTSQDIHGVALKIKEATSKGYAEAQEGDSINLSVPESKTRRGRVGKGVANTLDTSCEQGVPVIWYDKYSCYIAIRKLTPRECFRLQGWTDDYFEKAEFVNSDSQLYKQAGNGVTVNVVYEIGKVIRDNE